MIRDEVLTGYGFTAKNDSNFVKQRKERHSYGWNTSWVISRAGRNGRSHEVTAARRDPRGRFGGRV